MTKNRRRKPRTTLGPLARTSVTSNKTASASAFVAPNNGQNDRPDSSPTPPKVIATPIYADAGPTTAPLQVALTDLSRPLQLNRLPYNVLAALFSRRYLPPTTLIELACTSKATANVALPELYSTLLIGSFSAFPRLCTTLQARPELAYHVRTLFGGEDFLFPLYFSPYVREMQSACIQPGSPIVSVAKARSLGIGASPRFAREKMLMPWLVHVATLCPNLVSVDLSKVTIHLIPNTKALFFGLLDLAAVLGPRGGRFLSSHMVPFSAILVNNFWMSKPLSWKPDVFFVYAMDWSKKQIDVTSRPSAHHAPDGRESITPFRDLVGSNEYDQWTLRDVHLATAHRMGNLSASLGQFKGHVSQWLSNPPRLWTNAGLSRVSDHMFDLSMRPSAIKGEVTIYVHFLELIDYLLPAVNVDPGRQCTTLFYNGTMLDPNAPVEPMIMKGYRDSFSHLRNHPKPWITTLYMDVSYFVTDKTAPVFIACIAEGLPNLVTFGMLKINCPLDLVLYYLDPLLRRDPAVGNRLKNLMLAINITNRVGSAARLSTTAATPLQPLSAKARTPLAADRENHDHLETLTLEVDGPGLHLLDKGSLQPPTVAIHPGLLHGLTQVCLKQVQLYVMPAHKAQPSSPSFMPVDHVRAGSLAARDQLSFNHELYLHRLHTLTVTSNAVLPSLVPVTCFHELLPRCPNLQVLRFFVDDVHEGKLQDLWTPESIAKALPTFPKLVNGCFNGFANLNDAAMSHMEDTLLGVYPKEARPCPHLTHFNINGYLYEHFELEVDYEVKQGREFRLPARPFLPTCVETTRK